MLSLICPRCEKRTESVAADVSCGDCLMNDVEVVKMIDARLTHFLAVGPFCWGRATKEHQAIHNMKKHAVLEDRRKPRKMRYIIYRATEKTSVNDMGGIVRPATDPAPVELRRHGF